MHAFRQSDLVEDFEDRRMERIAAELAAEILVRFEHCDFDASTRQQQPKHHAAGAAAHDATVRLLRRIDAIGVPQLDIGNGCGCHACSGDYCSESAQYTPVTKSSRRERPDARFEATLRRKSGASPMLKS